MPNPMSPKQKLTESDQRLQDFERAAKAELSKIQTQRAELRQQIEAESASEDEARVLAHKQGLPLDVARSRLAKERGVDDGPVDTSKMSREQYLDHRRKVHGF